MPRLAHVVIAACTAFLFGPPYTAFSQTAIDSPVLLPIDGAAVEAEVESIDDDLNVRFQRIDPTTKDRTWTLSASRFVSWGRRVETGKGPQILLADGSVLIADVLGLDAEQIVVGIDFDNFGDASLWEKVAIPLKHVRGVVFKPASDPLARDKLVHAILHSTGNHDQIILGGGDRVTGVLASKPAAPKQKPIVSIWLNPRGQDAPIPIPRAKITALIINPALVAKSEGQGGGMMVGFRDGSCVNARSLKAAGEWTTLSLSAGVALRVDTQTMLEQLCALRPWSEQVVYLSDLPERGYRHYPYLNLKWAYASDRSVLGGHLRWNDAVFTKGLCMHSKSRVAFKLDAEYRRFDAQLAIDQAAQRNGSVVFQVFLANEAGKWAPAFESPTVRGGDPLRSVSIDVSEAHAMLLVVDYADHGDVWDHACWLSARLSK